MKRIALGAWIVLLGTVAVAEEAKRYVVVTRRPAQLAVSALARERGTPVGRRVDSFRIIDGFAANLTSTEVAELRRSPEVRWVEPVVARRLMADVSLPGEQILPFGIAQVRAPQAWLGRRSADVNVAVLDSGIDFRHPDLAASWAGGYNAIAPESSPLDDAGHGSHVAGTIGAVNNRTGVIGVAPGVRLWGVKVVDSKGDGTMEDVIKGLDWVLDRKAALGGRWVVNLSLGGDESSEAEREAFEHAADAGVIIVASTGNASTAAEVAPVAYPAAYSSVIAVGAVNNLNVRGTFSNAGPELDFMAPGVSVLSTLRSGFNYASFVRAGATVLESKPLVGSRLQTLGGHYVSCGSGNANEFPPEVRGRIALIQRGGDTFADKTRRAVAAGATAVVFYNINSTNIAWTLLPQGDTDAATYPWPVAVGVSLADGQPLAARGSGTLTIGYESDDYGIKSGTSMSAPHVTGAVALLWSFAPAATPAQIRQALTATAKDLGDAGRDDLHGHGVIDVHAAARLLAPEAFTPNTRSGRPYLRRGSR